MVLLRPVYKLPWCEAIEARVWSSIVVVGTPVSDYLSGVVVAVTGAHLDTRRVSAR